MFGFSWRCWWKGHQWVFHQQISPIEEWEECTCCGKQKTITG